MHVPVLNLISWWQLLPSADQIYSWSNCQAARHVRNLPGELELIRSHTVCHTNTLHPPSPQTWKSSAVEWWTWQNKTQYLDSKMPSQRPAVLCVNWTEVHIVDWSSACLLPSLRPKDKKTEKFWTKCQWYHTRYCFGLWVFLAFNVCVLFSGKSLGLVGLWGFVWGLKFWVGL